MKTERVMEWQSKKDGIGDGGFTLVELLVVIAIIALLASVTLGVTGLASRKMKEKRMEGELQGLVAKIEDYKLTLNMYPPDNPGKPSTNQLYYELTGAVFDGDTRSFRTADRQTSITIDQYKSVFGSDGISNSAREAEDISYTLANAFEESERANIRPTPPEAVVLVTPVKGPDQIGPTKVTPWNYVSTEPTNNAGRFDLWADVEIGGEIYRFNNWSQEAIRQ